MELDAPEVEHSALERLLSAAEHLTADFQADVEAVLSPIVAEVLADSGILLVEVLQSFGWDGQRFTRPVSVQAFICRLKALWFDQLEEKGKGAFATIYKARNRLSREIVTLKKLRMERTEEGVPAQAIREVSLLATLNHPNIVRLLDVMWDESKLYLILEYLDYDLRQHLNVDPEAAKPENTKRYMFQILQGLEHAHSKCVMHRDLKPQNILVDRATNSCKIADFGLARSYQPPVRAYTHEVVTLLYRPPEILLGTELYGTAVDMWSCGCIFAELATREALFPGDSEVHYSEIGQLFQIFRLLGTPDESTWPGVTQLPHWQSLFPQMASTLHLHKVIKQLEPLGLDLLKQMLAYHPKERITASQALRHPYFQGVQSDFSPGTPFPNGSRITNVGATSSDTDCMMAYDGERPTASSGFQP